MARQFLRLHRNGDPAFVLHPFLLLPLRLYEALGNGGGGGFLERRRDILQSLLFSHLLPLSFLSATAVVLS